VEYRSLGRTGVRVSTYCLGAMMFGPWGNPEHDDCARMIHRALDAGINIIDTADVYSGGESEEIVGKALRGRRDEVVLATKGHFPMGAGANERGNSRLWIARALEGSLRRLGTDHVDLYQLHRPDPEAGIEETLGVLTDLVREGKIRYLGSSTFPSWLLVEARRASERVGLERLSCEQPPYSIFARDAERDVFPCARRYGMGVLVWSPLAGGWLAGRYRRGEEAPPDSRAVRFRPFGGRGSGRNDPLRPENEPKLALVERLSLVARTAGLSLTHMSLAFTLAHPAVTSAIIGPRTMTQLEDLLAGADTRIDAGVLDAVDEIMPPGSSIEGPDRMWAPPWMAPGARRRP
jgi:aryl-alcohol dehydrogenase-like predicted oxidoreductase